MSTLRVNTLETTDGLRSVNIADLAFFSQLTNIAFLRLLSKLAADRVQVKGYFTAGDGGGGTYRLDANDNTSADNGGTVIVGIDGGRWKLEHDGTVSIKQFGGGFGNDDTGAFKSAGALALNVRVPRGNYTITSNVPAICNFIGDGKDVTKVLISGSGFDAFTFSTSYAGASGMTAYSTSSRSSGITFKVANATRGNKFSDIRTQNQFLSYAVASDAVQTYLYSLEILDPTPTTGGGIFIDGGNDTFMNNVVLDSSGTQPRFGLRIQNTQAVWATDCDFIHAGVPLLIDPATGDRITWCFFNNCAFDSSTSNGIEINVTGTGTLRGIFFNGCWSATNNRGVYIAKAAGAQLDTVDFANCKLMNNSLQGALVASGNNVSFKGGIVSGNGLATSNSYAGIDFQPGVTGFSVCNVRSGAVAGFNNIQSYGVLIGTGCNNYVITGNDLTGNATSAFADNSASTSTVREVNGNLGAKTRASGTATIPNGTASITVTHGLNGVPTSFLATPMASPGTNTYWTANASAAGFDIKTSGNVTGDLVFSWTASIY